MSASAAQPTWVIGRIGRAGRYQRNPGAGGDRGHSELVTAFASTVAGCSGRLASYQAQR